MQTKVFELCPQCSCISCFFFYSSTRNWSCVPFQVFFLRYTYKARRASPISTSTSTSTTLLDVPTLPYLTLHYSPSREVDTIQERKSGTVRRTNQYRQRHIPTYLGTYMCTYLGYKECLRSGRYTYLYTYRTLPTLGTYLTYHKSITMIHVRRRWTVASRNMHHHHFQIERAWEETIETLLIFSTVK